MKSNNQQRSRPARWWMSVIVLLGCAVFSVGESVEVLFEDGFEERPDQLDCEKFNYPCSLADADPDALARADALLTELWDIRKAGTLDDCHVHLSNQSDVVLIFRGDTSLSFQVEGMMPVVFDEIPDIPEAPLTRINVSPESITPGAGKTLRVVGEDSDENGIMDQRDKKKAWLLSPFEWLPSIDWGTDELAVLLNGVRAYQGNVSVHGNLLETDNFVHSGIWSSLEIPDVLIISTFAGQGSTVIEGQEQSFSWVSSGILANPLQDPADPTTGWTFGVHFSQSNELDPVIARRMVLTADFFKRQFLSQQDKLQLIVFSNGLLPPDISRSFQNTNSYQVISVTEGSSYDENRNSFLLKMFEWLAQGVTVDFAAAEANSFHSDIAIDVYRSGLSGSDQARIIELPRLMFRGSEAPLGFPLFDLVTGTVGDGTNDKLKLTVQIDGVTEETKPDFKVRYRIAQQSVPGSLGLEQADLVSGFANRYEVEHELDLGFPLESGTVLIEIIVDLPEGGESRYTGLGSLAACHFYALFSGEVSGAFAGPAGYNFNHDGTLGFFFKSTEFILALDPFEYPVWQSNINFAETGLPEEGGLIQATSADLTLGLHNYIYFPPGGEDWTCDTCGGEIQIGKVLADVSVAGSTNEGWIRMTRPPAPSDPPGYKATVDLQLVFVAAEGNLIDGGTPFNECAIEYDP